MDTAEQEAEVELVDTVEVVLVDTVEQVAEEQVAKVVTVVTEDQALVPAPAPTPTPTPTPMLLQVPALTQTLLLVQMHMHLLVQTQTLAPGVLEEDSAVSAVLMVPVGMDTSRLNDLIANKYVGSSNFS